MTTKLIYKYTAEDIKQDSWRKDFMLFDGWSGYKIYAPDGKLIGKSVTKGVAMDMARAHHKWSNQNGTIEIDANEKQFIEFFKDNFVEKYNKDSASVIVESKLTDLELMTREEELKEKSRLSKLFKKEIQK